MALSVERASWPVRRIASIVCSAPARTSPSATSRAVWPARSTECGRDCTDGRRAIRATENGTMVASIVVQRRTSCNPYRCWTAPGGAARPRLRPASTRWAWAHFEPWLEVRRTLPAGALFCVMRGRTRGRPCAPAAIRPESALTHGVAGCPANDAQQNGLRLLPVALSLFIERVRRWRCVMPIYRTAEPAICGISPCRVGITQSSAHWWLCRRRHKHQLRHAHAVEMSREGISLIVIQRQLGHADLAITSRSLRAIDSTEIIQAVHERPEPMIPVTRALARQR